MGILTTADRLLARLETVVAVTAMAGLVLMLIAQVVFRYGLGSPLFFAEEVGLLLLIVATFSGLSLLVAEDRLVAVDVFGAAMPPAVKRWTAWLMRLVTLAAALTLAAYGARYLSTPWVWLERSPTLDMPRAAIYAFVTGQLFALCVHLAIHSIAKRPWAPAAGSAP